MEDFQKGEIVIWESEKNKTERTVIRKVSGQETIQRQGSKPIHKKRRRRRNKNKARFNTGEIMKMR